MTGVAGADEGAGVEVACGGSSGNVHVLAGIISEQASFDVLGGVMSKLIGARHCFLFA